MEECFGFLCFSPRGSRRGNTISVVVDLNCAVNSTVYHIRYKDKDIEFFLFSCALK